MTPQKKAYTLFDRYMGFKMNPYDDPEMSTKKAEAKKNALIAIDEILKVAFYDSEDIFETLDDREYWHCVKQEIENL